VRLGTHQNDLADIPPLAKSFDDTQAAQSGTDDNDPTGGLQRGHSVVLRPDVAADAA
jgi:hypothetical protein